MLYAVLISTYLYVSTSPPKHAVVKQFQSYIDPEESSGPVGGAEEEGVALPLGDTTLICNIGVPIIVVCCKVSICVCIAVCVCVSVRENIERMHEHIHNNMYTFS